MKFIVLLPLASASGRFSGRYFSGYSSVTTKERQNHGYKKIGVRLVRPRLRVDDVSFGVLLRRLGDWFPALSGARSDDSVS